MTFGQILEVYDYKGSRWITVWNFRERSKFSVPLEISVPFRVGEIVTFDGTATDSMTIAVVDDLPDGIRPMLTVPKPLAANEYQHPFLSI